MGQVRITYDLSPVEHESVSTFLEAAHGQDRSRLNDHLAIDLTQGPRPGFVAALANGPSGGLVGYAQASATNNGFVVDCVVLPGPGEDAGELRALLLQRLLDELPGEAAVTWWVHDGNGDDTAALLRMRRDRRLLHMRRQLPIHDVTDVAVRPFEVGRDEEAWLHVNNAAFAWHGEQGGWELESLLQREREDWFDADGFLLHERGGRLAAFCWTKLHHDGRVGEIYVIAVHPDFHGLGLGRALTVAGLRHLQAAGATEAMLYVDDDNTAAVRLYESLGFHVHQVDQAYLRSRARDHS